MPIYVYRFGAGEADGRADQKVLLGGKGANLAEMTALGIPVPPGFTITTEVCTYFTDNAGAFPPALAGQVDAALERIGELTGTRLGDAERPLLVSVRSGAASSMPGMMDTVLNLGLNDETVLGLAKSTSNPRFAYDCYRRFVAMYGDVVMGVIAASEEDDSPFERILDEKKRELGLERDADLTVDALKELVTLYKIEILRARQTQFPDDPRAQLWGAIGAVLRSWNSSRAQVYRRLHDIPATMGTAVNVQAMVFGNMGEDSASGVAFTRNPATGEPGLYGEYLVNSQGEDVVSGVRTPETIDQLAAEMPAIHAELISVADRLEKRFGDMQDLEFTIQRGKLWMLQTRNGKRTGRAMIRIAVELVREGLINEREAIGRIDPEKLEEVMHPTIDPASRPTALAKGLPASPGAAIGKIVFTASEAEQWALKGEKVILVRPETSPEDIHGMKAAQGILTARGGMTCLAGDNLLLTESGFASVADVFAAIECGEPVRLLSFDSRRLRPVWREVIAAGRKPGQVIDVALSQTGQADGNVVRLTGDHKVFVIEHRQLLKKPVLDALRDEDFATVVGEVPATLPTVVSPELAYVAGAILSDGHVSLKATKGSVTFIQKPTDAKARFIAEVERAFHSEFGFPFSYVRQRTSHSELRGRSISGSVEDRICFRREPAARLAAIRDQLCRWVLTLDRTALLAFLAGYVDGDGTYAETSSAVRLQISVAAAKPQMLQGVALACLRLGIVPQVVHNRDDYLIQIAEQVEEILAFTHRVKAEIPARMYESRCLSVKALFDDIVDDVNFMGRVREGIKRNLMFGAGKIRRDVLPLCAGDSYRQLDALLQSPLRSYRMKAVAGPASEPVYNFEVDADTELDKNYIVFTSRLTPVLVSNSHAAVVARGMGKTCITGCSGVKIEVARQRMTAGGQVFNRGDVITLDGSTGEIYAGATPLVPAKLTEEFELLMSWVDEVRRLKVRTNADTPVDARTARAFGAEGIGLCRTEHMFFAPERILAVREMILADSEAGRRAALAKILPMQRDDFVEIFRAMDGLPVTIRLLDPPLHEFLPHTSAEIAAVAKDIGADPAKLARAVEDLREENPMLGHRGCRLAISYPEIYETQAQAIAEAVVLAHQQEIDVHPEIMIPFVSVAAELRVLREQVCAVIDSVLAQAELEIPYLVGTMIELPRACLTGDKIARYADFFSFGTNDLTQTVFGLSRDDSGRFLPRYLDGLFAHDPFVVLDRAGVGALIRIGVEKGRKEKTKLKVGICGEHGGEPSSVEFCHVEGFDYVSCSPFRVPIARVAAARAALRGEARSK